MYIVKHRRIFLAGSLLLIGVALHALFSFGLNLGSDFTGGTVLEIEYQTARPDLTKLKTAVDALKLPSLSLQPVGERGLVLKSKVITEAEKESLNKVLAEDGQSLFTEKRFSEVGPTLGKELTRKGLIAITLVVILIILFIAIVFRQVSAHHMQSWKYGIASIIALAHDIIISAGAMALLGHFYGAEADALFLTALLAILGLSINDTIVVFDRIRENLNRHSSNNFSEVAGISIDETYVRSLNTTLTTVVVLMGLFLFGPESTRFFSVILLVGMTAGTYSSIFVASNILVEWEAWQRGKVLAKAKR
ncbi:MAG TPA: protein translocase subunit SecF [Candidatus Paceibacterota bacterium]|nr:protein translocase subunit SecF [Candidatus Paceibacterota bacterium]